MDYLVLPHFGLGDQLIMNGYIRNLLEEKQPNSITIIADGGYQRKTLEHLYSDVSNVKMFWMDNLHKGPRNPFILQLAGHPFGCQINLDGKVYTFLSFGHYSQWRNAQFPGFSWADTFYLQGNEVPSLRYTKFTLPKNMTGSEEIYSRVTSKIGNKYILINDEPSINRNFDESLVYDILSKSGNQDLPVLYLGFHRYKYPLFKKLNNKNLEDDLKCDSLLDLWKLISEATECHFMDSSISCLTDIIPNCKGLLHIHAYATDYVDKEFPIYSKSKWNIIFKD